MNTANTQRIKKEFKIDFALVFTVKKKEGICYCTLKVFYFFILTFKLTFNNIFFTLTSSKGAPFLFLSAGLLSLRNSQKTTPLATRAISIRLFELLMPLGFALISINITGFGTRLRVFLMELRTFIKQNRNMYLI